MQRGLEKRGPAAVVLPIVSFCAVAGMLVKLMLVDHDYYEAKAIRNQTRSTSVTASRGTIYDRNGNVLAASSSVENVFCVILLNNMVLLERFS